MRLKSRGDATFPSSKTFSKRYESKAKLLRRIAEYCESQIGCDDIILWCREYAPRKSGIEEELPQEDTAIGFIYLIRSGRFHKIGRTNATGRREYELAIQLPEKAATVHIIRTDDPAGIEAYWHRRFDSKRKNGEWFELNRTDIAAFKRLKFM